MRKQITFSVPEEVHQYVLMRVAATGYGSASEYFRELIRKDRLEQIQIAREVRRTAPAVAGGSGDHGDLQDRPVRTPLASASRRYR